MKSNKIYIIILKIFAFTSVAILLFVLSFIINESIPLFQEISVKEFIFGVKWKPISYTGSSFYGILPFILSTIAVSTLAVFLSAVVGIGISIYISCIATTSVRNILTATFDLLAAIPSVIYGFLGLVILVPIMQRLGRSSGESIFVAGIVLATMLLPYIISTCSETMLKHKKAFGMFSDTLGVSNFYTIGKLIMPLSYSGILTSLVLAITRAMSETMAVMMVMGNAPIFPKLFGKGESIASLIALEMGTSEIDSTHYHALFSAGLTLLILITCINSVIFLIRRHLTKRTLI